MSDAIERPKTYEEGLRDGFHIGQEKANKVMEQMLHTACNPVPIVCDLPETEAVKLLQKENTELKEELKKWKDEWQEQVQKAIDEGYARTLQTIQLTKAKEIIEKLLNAFASNDFFEEEELSAMAEAEQFLKGENIILEDAQVGNSPFDADKVFNKEMKAYPEEK